MPRMMDAPQAFARWAKQNESLDPVEFYKVTLWFFRKMKEGKQVDVWEEPGRVEDMGGVTNLELRKLCAQLEKGDHTGWEKEWALLQQMWSDNA